MSNNRNPTVCSQFPNLVVTDKSPYEQLGLSEDASFEEIQEARKLLTTQHSGDRQQVESIEAAYDAVLMDRLRLRQEGKIKVPEGIRFPERIVPPQPASASESTNIKLKWLQPFLDTPSRSDILWPMGVFLAGVFIILIGDRMDQTSDNPISLQLALAISVGSSIYFLNRKEGRLGRSVLLASGGLFGGLILGTLLGNLLPTFDLLDTDQFAALVTFFVLWLVSSFLR